MRGSNLEMTICNCFGGRELAENATLAEERLGGARKGIPTVKFGGRVVNQQAVRTLALDIAAMISERW